MRFSRTPLIAALLGVAAAGTVHADDVPHQQVPQLVKDGTIQSLETLDKVAMDTHPDAQITDTDLENEYGRYIYQVELRDGQGQDWDVDIDASTGDVLKDERD